MQELKKAKEELSRLWHEADHTNDPDEIRRLTHRILAKEKEIKLIIKQSNNKQHDN